MSIFKLQQISQIMQFEDDLQKNYDKLFHIKRCYDALYQSLFDYFENNYLFHTSYFLDEKGILHNVNFDVQLSRSKKIAVQIEGGTKLIAEGRIRFSFTKSMCEAHKQILCLFKSSKNLSYPELGDLILTQNIEDKDAAFQISTFFNQKVEDVETLIQHYLEIVNSNPSSNYYIYFIRPFTNFEHYNGVFSIFLNTSLKESEIIELGSIWTKILSDTAVIEVKNQEQNSIFEEHNHTWSSDITALNHHLNVIDRRFKTDTHVMDHSGIRSNINFAIERTKILREIVSFNLFLMKTQGYRKWNEIERHKFSDSSRNLIDAHSVKSVFISDILHQALETIEMMIESVQDIDLKGYEIKKVQIKKLYHDIDQFQEVEIATIPIGLYIIFLDLLKNAFEHGIFNGNIQIEQHIDSENCCLLFINDGQIHDDKLIHFNSDDRNKELNFFSKNTGTKTIKRIIECPLFMLSDKKCELKPINYPEMKKVAICLTIPI